MGNRLRTVYTVYPQPEISGRGYTKEISPVSKDSKHQVSKDRSNQEGELCNVDFPRRVAHQTPLQRQQEQTLILKAEVVALSVWIAFFF